MDRRSALRDIAGRILGGALAAGFRGSDPYDGLRSRLLGRLAGSSRFLRLLLIQGVRRCPFDLRRLLLIPPGLNPKGLALFLLALRDLPGADPDGSVRRRLGATLLSLASHPDGSSAAGIDRERLVRSGELPEEAPELGGGAVGWGYDFPWQGRAFMLPAWTPTGVCTSFALDALAGEEGRRDSDVIAGTALFVMEGLNATRDGKGLCFSYSPLDRTRVHNASLFAAAVLARAVSAGLDGDGRMREAASSAAGRVAASQSPDGGWVYGEAGHWRWMDGLHTGFVLETLDRVGRLLGTDEWEPAVDGGLAFYREHLIGDGREALYFPDRSHPLDPHSFAQAALTFIALERYGRGGRELAGDILERGVELLWDRRRCGFVYRRGRLLVNGAAHIRWSQAWMMRAVCRWLAVTGGEGGEG